MDTKQASCLIVVDMQNEFLLETGNFPKCHIPIDTLIKNVADVIDTFKSKGIPIIFVKSEYDLNVDKSLKGMTHCGKTPCCVKGSVGAKIQKDIEKKIEKDDYVITKKWYSAFKNTNLNDILTDKFIDKVYFIGIKTNICIFNSVMDALNFGYNCVVFEDCTASSILAKHECALNQCKIFGVEVCTKNSMN